jgi:hypothetical protein
MHQDYIYPQTEEYLISVLQHVDHYVLVVEVDEHCGCIAVDDQVQVVGPPPQMFLYSNSSSLSSAAYPSWVATSFAAVIAVMVPAGGASRGMWHACGAWTPGWVTEPKLARTWCRA